MKKIFLVCFLVAGMATLGRAQNAAKRGHGQPAPEEKAKQMQAQLKLTDDQTAKITAIYTAQVAKRDSMKKAGADKTAMRPLMGEANKQVMAVLTPPQRKEFKTMQKEMHAKTAPASTATPPAEN